MRHYPYAVIPAPGYYGDHCYVVSVHASRLTAIKNAANGHYTAIEGQFCKGQKLLRANMYLYRPVV